MIVESQDQRYVDAVFWFLLGFILTAVAGAGGIFSIAAGIATAFGAYGVALAKSLFDAMDGVRRDIDVVGNSIVARSAVFTSSSPTTEKEPSVARYPEAGSFSTLSVGADVVRNALVAQENTTVVASSFLKSDTIKFNPILGDPPISLEVKDLTEAQTGSPATARSDLSGRLAYRRKRGRYSPKAPKSGGRDS